MKKLFSKLLAKLLGVPCCRECGRIGLQGFVSYLDQRGKVAYSLCNEHGGFIDV